MKPSNKKIISSSVEQGSVLPSILRISSVLSKTQPDGDTIRNITSASFSKEMWKNPVVLATSVSAINFSVSLYRS